ncbi:hypothetical protein Tco_1536068, partial [Tanacetum coccineum]
DRQLGDDEEMALDETFITALEYGLPLANNWWLGVPQALNFILLYGKHELLPFPATKPHNELPVRENLKIRAHTCTPVLWPRLGGTVAVPYFFQKDSCCIDY